MSSVNIRILLAAAILGGVGLMVGVIRRGAWTRSTDVSPAFQKLPAKLGNWVLDTKATKELFLDPPTDAASTVTGVYYDSAGVRVPLELDMFTLLDVSLPHPPEQCYNLSGCRVLGHRDTLLPLGADNSVNVRLMTVDRNGQRMSVLFWYNLDKEVVVNRAGLFQVRWKLRNQRRRPLVVKIMMQTMSPNMSEAEERLRSLAAPLVAWIRNSSG